MSLIKVHAAFSSGFRGRIVTNRAEIPVGSEDNMVSPYDMLFGALASCMYHTFAEILTKKRIDFSAMDIEVSGEKREEIPPTLKYVHMKFNIHCNDDSNHDKIHEALEITKKYCSVYATISHVAEMSTEIVFERRELL